MHDAGVPKCSRDRACHFAPADLFLVDAGRGHELEPTARNGDVDACSVTPYELEGGLNPRIQTFGDALYFSFVTASTVGYGDVTPVTGAGKVLTGLLIFVGIGLLGFASAQLTTRLMPQKNELAELRATMDRHHEVLLQIATRVDAMATSLEQSSEAQLQSISAVLR